MTTEHTPDPAIRAGDDDRRTATDVLSAAFNRGFITADEYAQRSSAAKTATTRAELDVLTRDLPSTELINVSPGSELPATTTLTTVLHGSKFSGGRVGTDLRIVAAIGGTSVDLRDTEFIAPATTITVRAVLGGIDITVPANATIDVSGIGVLGGFSRKASGKGVEGGPTLIIKGQAVLGGVDVTRAN